ncbi:MAG: ATP-binding cassette domain-containing protein [Actinomycetota bacterium]|nr:ATP-binding cassette domain-containing protein [Actinomycetota bacterium]
MTSAPDSILALCDGVGRTYGTGEQAVVAVYDANCSVARGDRIAIIGPSGSGKSTLLHLLAGLEQPTVGQISWPALGGHPRDGAHRVGLVFQAPTLIPSLTVLENVELSMLLIDVAPAESRERARGALDLLELDALRDDLPQELSGGQAQRVVIARVLAAQPPLILADEPTSQLDRDTAAHVADVLVEASDRIGAALVVATHDPAIGSRLSTLWPVQDGRVHPATTPTPATSATPVQQPAHQWEPMSDGAAS